MRIPRANVESSPVTCENIKTPSACRLLKWKPMPLSEDEQRILRQIEQELEQDPSFSERGVAVSRRRLVTSLFGAVVGVVATVLALAVSYLVAFLIFVGVVALSIVVANEIAVIGREQLSGASISAWAASARARRQG
ncbi:MAG TPA: hypothetical protein DCY63_06785 [Acidimicrobiaceae bacterium]|nr:hypothetical protein [Acidimicrobiaceae bacterium]